MRTTASLGENTQTSSRIFTELPEGMLYWITKRQDELFVLRRWWPFILCTPPTTAINLYIKLRFQYLISRFDLTQHVEEENTIYFLNHHRNDVASRWISFWDWKKTRHFNLRGVEITVIVIYAFRKIQWKKFAQNSMYWTIPLFSL